jgi:hypothetical protein
MHRCVFLFAGHRSGCLSDSLHHSTDDTAAVDTEVGVSWDVRPTFWLSSLRRILCQTRAGGSSKVTRNLALWAMCFRSAITSLQLRHESSCACSSAVGSESIMYGRTLWNSVQVIVPSLLHQLATDCHSKSARGCDAVAASSSRPGRTMPSFFIRNCRVDRFIPSRAAAPLGPPRTHLVSFSVRRM